MRSLAVLILAGAAALGCSGASNGSNPGTGGGGGTGGSAGGSGGSGGGAPFMAFASGLAVPAGTAVTFSGDFATHPLIPSAMRGNTTQNPIAATNSGTSATFTFPNPGFYAYLCMFHGSDDGSSMSGVIWVQ
jgi:plastocyanin